MAQSVASAFFTYLKRSDLSDSTVEIKQRALKFFTQWFGDLTVDQLSPAIAEEYRTLLGKGRAAGGANTYLRVWKPFSKWLWTHGMIPSDPFHGVRELREAKVKKVTFDADELARMVRVSDVRWRVLVGLGLCGLRRGEALNLVVRDIIFSDHYILLASKPESDQTWRWTIKNHTQRFVPLPETIDLPGVSINLHGDLITLIDQLDQTQPYVCLKAATYKHNLDLIRTGRWNHYRAEDPWGNFPRAFRKLQARANVTPAKRYHELRADFITQMIASQGLTAASRLAGHATVQQTAEYDRQNDLRIVANSTKSLVKCYASKVL